MSALLHLDGATGEGGGQVLRSSLALSLLTGTPFELRNIRAGRAKPGLGRQHLTCVRAAATISGATVEGDAVGSQRLVFRPGAVRPGDHTFAIGTAGSTGLVLQTILLPLLLAERPSTIRIEGGTHNSASPPFHFLDGVFLPALREMGADVTLELHRWGFFPAGGGAIVARIAPSRLRPFERTAPPASMDVHGHVAISATPTKGGHYGLHVFQEALGLDRAHLHLHDVPRPVGPGMAAWVEARFDGGRELFTAFGERREQVSDVARTALDAFEGWRAQAVPVGEHLADQLLLPLALTGGRFRSGPPSLHTRTNATIIERFLPVHIGLGETVEVRHGAAGAATKALD